MSAQEMITHTTKNLAVLIVDRSGSMETTKSDATGGIKRFIEDRVKDHADIVLIQFDDHYEQVFGPVPADQAPSYTLVPRGFTALYDAIGKGIGETTDLVDKQGYDKVAIVIVTDGIENASREYDHGKMEARIEDAKGRGWEVIFLASEPKTVAMGQASGMTSMPYDPTSVGTQRAYGVASAVTQDYFVQEAPTSGTPVDVTIHDEEKE